MTGPTLPHELDAVLDANRRYVGSSHPPSGQTARPRRRLVVVTCMDARLDLFGALGLEVGDAHLLRNAGGRVTDDVVRSLVLSSHVLETREFGVIHHTRCGLEAATNDALHALVRENTGVDPMGELDFLPFDDVDQSVRDDLERLRSVPYLPAGSVTWGAVYDVADGSIRVVVEPQPVPGA